jgi:hypothetical protein
MTQTATLAGKDQHITFFNVFNRSKNEPINPTVVESFPTTSTEHPMLRWFEKSKYLTVVNTKFLSAGNIFQVNHVIVRFKLSSAYHDRFILLRGLLEFSRPKNISISTNTAEKTFELRVSDDQVQFIRTYLDTILSLLVKEIKFKASLNSVLKFEQSFKSQQSKLYEELRSLA